MSVKLIAVKCPECGANLQIEEGREQVFCSYCGTKIIITNDNEYIYRHIDEAEIKQAETERIVELKKLEMEEKQRDFAEKTHSFKVKLSLLLGVIVLLSYGIGFSTHQMGLTIIGSLSVMGIMGIWASEGTKNNSDSEGRIRIPSGVNDFERKNYIVVEEALKSVGFTNIKCVPLHDLTAGLLKKPNMVSSITVDGQEIEVGGKKFMPDATIVISYHSYK